jgi:hypothetical protein
MKKLLIIAFVVLLVGCKPYTFSQLETKDYERYIEYPSYSSSAGSTFDGSPLSYNVLKGSNSLADYDYKIVRIKSYWFTYYSGDPSLLLNAKFPDADLILAYNTYFYIGYKKR